MLLSTGNYQDRLHWNAITIMVSARKWLPEFGVCHCPRDESEVVIELWKMNRIIKINYLVWWWWYLCFGPLRLAMLGLVYIQSHTLQRSKDGKLILWSRFRWTYREFKIRRKKYNDAFEARSDGIGTLIPSPIMHDCQDNREWCQKRRIVCLSRREWVTGNQRDGKPIDLRKPRFILGRENDGEKRTN